MSLKLFFAARSKISIQMWNKMAYVLHQHVSIQGSRLFQSLAAVQKSHRPTRTGKILAKTIPDGITPDSPPIMLK